MDMRSQQTLERKRTEIKVQRELSASKKQESNIKRYEALRKQREEENMDRKADKAKKHSEKLRREREQSVIKIGSYHRKIDFLNRDMKDCERNIDEYRIRI